MKEWQKPEVVELDVLQTKGGVKPGTEKGGNGKTQRANESLNA